jgi:hypothetical protein
MMTLVAKQLKPTLLVIEAAMCLACEWSCEEE